MWAALIVVAQPRFEDTCSQIGVPVGPGVSPFPQQGLDEAFGLAVRLRAIGTGFEQPDRSTHAQPIEGVRAVAASVIGEDSFRADAVLAIPGERPFEEASRGGAELILKDLGVSKTRCIVDADMDKFPVCPSDSLRAVSVDSMSDPTCDSCKLFHVQVQQLAGSLALVAPRDRRWVDQVRIPAQAEHRFRAKVNTCSGMVNTDSGHGERSFRAR